jgi:Flp pilus assembly protein TadG
MQSGRPRPAWRRHRHQAAQSMVETAMVLPIILLFVFVTIDLGRAAYTWVQVGHDAEVAARYDSLPDNQASDCSAINAVVKSGNGLTIAVDSNSMVNDAPAGWSAPSSLPANSGALYIYPAQAASAPVQTNCSNPDGSTQRPTASTVTAQVNFNFQPWTPIASQILPTIVLSASATEATQY